MPQKTSLANGIRIVSEKMPHVRSTSMGVWVDVGARDESEEQSGLSHFIEHMIFKGTARRTAFQIAKEFDAIGGHTNAFTSMENTCYHAKVMDEHTDTMVDILSDIFLNSVFDSAEVERERSVIYQEIGMMEDSPEEYVYLLSGNNFWGDHPLGRSILGSRENILGFKAENIKTYFRRYYHPERIVISLAGNVDHTRMVDLLGPTFETISAGEPLPERTTPLLRPTAVSHSRSLEQVHICLAALGLSVIDPRRFAFSLLNTITGGNMSSRLFQQIREKQGLAYSVYSFTNSHVDTGMFGVYAGIAAENIAKTLAIILDILNQLRCTPVTPEELHDAKAFTKGNLYLAAESVDNLMVRLAQTEIHFQEYIPLERVSNQLEAVTREEIQSLAQALFSAENVGFTLLGPCGKTLNLDELIHRHLN